LHGTLIPLVSDDFFQRLRFIDLRVRVFDLVGRGRQRFLDRRGIADPADEIDSSAGIDFHHGQLN
jgi:hypothetical protein